MRAGISISRLLHEARINQKTWWRSRRDKAVPRDGTLRKLADALDRLTGIKQARPPINPLLATYRLAAKWIAEIRGIECSHVALLDFSTEKPNDPAWLAIARVRMIAMYVVTVEFEIKNAELARAIGCSRQNVKKARDRVEDWREEDAAVAALIARVAALAGDGR